MRERGPGDIGAGIDHADVTCSDRCDGRRRRLGNWRDSFIARWTEEMIGSDAGERRECLQLTDGLLHRTSALYTNACKRFSECCQWSLRDDGEAGLAHGIDRSLIRDHEHFSTHALATCGVAF